MIVDCISDLHKFYPKLEGGDLLIVAGDLTARDQKHEYETFLNWIYKQRYSKKILIAGNHDNYLMEHHDKSYLRQLAGYDKDDVEFEYLCDSGTEFEGLKIWGSPWSKTFERINPHCKAFTVDTEEELATKFSLIPDDTDILITHSPMLHMLDQNMDGYHCGSYALRSTVDRVKPKLFVFGHIHECGGQNLIYKHLGPNTMCVNASQVNEFYKPVNKPIRVIL